MKKSVTPQEQARLDAARRDMINYWQQTPPIDRVKVIEEPVIIFNETPQVVQPVAAKVEPLPARVYLNDLDPFMRAHPDLCIPPRTSAQGDAFPVIVRRTQAAHLHPSARIAPEGEAGENISERI